MNGIELVEKRALQRLMQDELIYADCGIGGYHRNQVPVEVRAVIRAGAKRFELSEYPGPKGVPSLCNALVQYNQRTLGIELPGMDACVVFGGRDGLFQAVATFLRSADEAFQFCPGYGGQFLAVRDAGARSIPVRPGKNLVGNLLSAIQGSSGQGKIIIYDSISNPTGDAVTLDQLEEIADIAERENCWILEDGVYREIALDGPPPPSMLQIKRARKRLLVLMSGSKNYGLGGLRIGGLVGPKKLISQEVAQKKQGNYGPCILAQWAYEEALKKCEYYIQEKIAEMRGRRQMIQAGFAKAGWAIPSPSFGIFNWFDTPDGQNAVRFCPKMAAQTGWKVYPGPDFCFDPEVAEQNRTKIRLAMMEPVGQIRKGLPVLADWLRHI